jgi:hypothetical protein
MGAVGDSDECVLYFEGAAVEKVGASSFSGRDGSGDTIGSLGDCERGWGAQWCTCHGFAPADVVMNPLTFPSHGHTYCDLSLYDRYLVVALPTEMPVLMPEHAACGTVKFGDRYQIPF